MKADLFAKGIHPFSLERPEAPRIGFLRMGDHWTQRPGNRLLVGKSEHQLINIVDASASGAFVPN
jgi:hypothetical protein